MFSNKSDTSDRSPIANQRATGVRSPGASGGGRRNFSFHTQHIGSILGPNRARSNAGSGLSTYSKSNISEPVRVEEEEKEYNLVDLSNIQLPNYEHPK